MDLQEEVIEQEVEQVEEVVEAEEVEQPEQEEQAEDDGEIVVTLGDQPVSEPDPEDKGAPAWVKQLRKDYREAQRELKELKAAKTVSEQPKIPEVGKEPELDDDDIDYDAGKYKAALSAWMDRKRQAEKAVEAQKAEAEAASKQWQDKLDGYQAHKAKLKLPDYEDAEQTITESMDVTQQGIIISGADNPALVVYALGKNPDKAKELAAIKDPVKFAFAIAKLETQVKTQPKSKPAPERTVSGNAPKSGSVDSNLDRLRAEAEKTGDYSKVVAYRKQQKK